MREVETPTVSILPGDAQWRSRKVRYYSGTWDAILTPELCTAAWTWGGLSRKGPLGTPENMG